MTTLNGTLPLLSAVRVTDLRAYLLSKGWKLKPFKRQQMICFVGPLDDDGKPIELLVPASESLRDYLLRIEDLVQTLSTLEDRPAYEIVRNIMTPTSDILHLRLESPQTRTGTLELGFVEQFFASVKNLLVFAACSEIRPQPFYARALKSAVQFADRCRVRPAPASSFRVDVEAPIVPPANEEQVELGDYPAGRLILLSLMRVLGDLQRAIETGQSSRLLYSSAERINANLCEAILGMRPAGSEMRWEASVSWSPAWPLDETPGTHVVFKGKAFEQIDAISRALRTGKEPGRRTIRGRVVRLAAENPVHEETGSYVVTLHVDSANGPTHISLALTAAQYQEACTAHLQGQRIAVKGLLHHEGRKWRLLDISDFQVLSEATL